MTKSVSIPKFGLNRPKNYLGYVFAVEIGASTDEIDRILDERNIVSNRHLARRGAEQLDLVTGPDSLKLTEFGNELIALAERELDSAEAAIDELGKLYGKADRLVEAQPIWHEFLQEAIQRHSGTNRLITLMQEIHTTTETDEFDLPEIFFEMYCRDPEFAGELFLREGEVETRLPLSTETLDSDPLRTEFSDPELYYGPTVQALKSVLYHAGILTTAGSDARSLEPGKEPYTWALEPEFKIKTVTELSQFTTAELPDPDEEAVDHQKPNRKDVTTSRIIRNSKIVNELKDLYDYTCQVCGQRRQHNPNEGYAEGHHVKPLGSEHEGRDTKANILILCPTCHADFDYGMIRVDLQDHSIRHAYDDGRNGIELSVDNGHGLNYDNFRYHNEEIAKFSD